MVDETQTMTEDDKRFNEDGMEAALQMDSRIAAKYNTLGTLIS